MLDAYGWLDGSMGMLTYALVRDGRPQEAIHVAESNLALWRAGQLSDGLGARWDYRLANSLNATQQFTPALAAAQQSDAMLQRAGVSAASHTGWLARQEIVRALIGLRRWSEADASYSSFWPACHPTSWLAPAPPIGGFWPCWPPRTGAWTKHWTWPSARCVTATASMVPITR
ncbi:hypothetical protein [Candidatus Aalborgicola defluviihabitans]|uniref:hypothetical protein n=1 Tax=Candidatus Aalborgicola defluviihabitans TaxID=3386187 RepID=UPI001DD42E92|nr:hypothetical protein [Burkholderiales bacterium]